MAPLFDPAPPDARSRVGNNPTLLFSWWTTISSVVIIIIRVFGRYSRNSTLFHEDKIMAYSVLPLIARMACIHVVLIWGTNNVNTKGLDNPLVIQHREVGSRLVLAARIFYALFIWMAKWTVSEFLKRLTDRFWKKSYEYVLLGIRIFLLVTFVGVVIATLGECQPFSHYWQVVPDPGHQCRQGYAHLLTMGVTDIVTDILLIVFPVPIILASSMGLKRKVSLLLLFSMSGILIAITAARIPAVIARNGLQQFRTVFASGEILAAAAVSNFIILGSFLRDRGPKKNRYKSGSVGTDSMDRRGSTRRPTLQAWGSDEDLIRDLGYRLSPELQGQRTHARPAPVADLDLLSRRGGRGGPSKFPGKGWNFPNEQAGTERTIKWDNPADQAAPGPLDRGGPPSSRRVSFFDVGGLLGDSAVAEGTAPSPIDSVIAHDFAHHPRRESSSRATASPAERNNRLLSPTRGHANVSSPRSPYQFPRPVSQPPEDYEMPIRLSQQLQDAGGLLEQATELAAMAEAESSVPPATQNDQVAEEHDNVPALQDAGGLLGPK